MADQWENDRDRHRAMGMWLSLRDFLADAQISIDASPDTVRTGMLEIVDEAIAAEFDPKAWADFVDVVRLVFPRPQGEVARG